MQGPMLKALRRFTQLLRVHIYVPGCFKYIRMTNGLQPLVELCIDGCFAGLNVHSKRLYRCPLSNGAMQKAEYAADTATWYF